MRTLVAVSLLGLVPALFAAPDWENPAVFRMGKEEPRAVLMPYPDLATAMTCQRMDSSWSMSLNGEWKFHWVDHPDKRPVDFSGGTSTMRNGTSLPYPRMWSCRDTGRRCTPTSPILS